MKIAVPLDENRQDVCIVLARAPYFLFRENGRDTIVEIRQPKHREAQGFRQRSFWWTAVSILCLQSAAERCGRSL